MKCSFRKVALSIFALYIGISTYTAYLLIVKRFKDSHSENGEKEAPEIAELKKRKSKDDEWNPWGMEFDDDGRDAVLDVRQPIDWQKDFGMKDVQEQDQQNSGQHIVEIWGKAAIGNYLWEHIIEGKTEARMGGVWSYGTKQIGNILFRYRTGPGVVPAKVPQNVENLVLVLNGREENKVEFAKMWLDYLPNFQNLKNIALILLGNEKCDNDWVKAYLTSKGGMVKFIFLVYDSPDVDDHTFYQWPLGVATYRNFPLVSENHVSLEDFRPFQCNFLGTVYKNSSREVLLRVIRDFSLTQTCYINPRLHWVPSETVSSLDEYTRALSNSDLTLNPVGQNTECYRIYEAMSYGSIPVIEDKRTAGSCLEKPLSLLKQYKAPAIYLNNWHELPNILKKEKTLTLDMLVQRRKEIIKWYTNFKLKMRDKFCTVIGKRFFKEG